MITKLKEILGIGAIGGLFFGGSAHGALSSSDLAIIGYHSDSSDAFSWVALNTINAGEVIYFSDSSYESSTSSFTPEGMMKFVAPSAISAGTVSTVTFVTPFTSLPPGYTVELTTAYSGTDVNGNASFNFASAGDQFVIFQDPDPSDSLGFLGLSAINMASNQWGGTPADSATESDLYPGMTNGLNALALGAGAGPSDEFDNGRYVGPFVGSPEFILSNIYDLSNWEVTDTSQGANSGAWTNASGLNSFVLIPEPSNALLLCIGGIFLARRKR